MTSKGRLPRTRRTANGAGTKPTGFGGPRLRKIPTLAALSAGLGLLLGGCGGDGGPAQSEESVTLLSVDAPLREPTWVQEKDFTLALGADDSRIARINTGSVENGDAAGDQAPTSSEGLEEIGENMALNSLKADEVYLPQPNLGQVVLVNTADLREARSYDAGEAPEWVTLHTGSQMLFALSEGGSTVSALDTENYDTTFGFRVDAGEQARIEAPEKGLEPEFWIWGPDGIAHYAGFPPERKVSMPINAGAFATDVETAQRAYVGEATSNRVVAVEGDPEGLLEGKLEVVAEQDLGERAEHVEAEELRVFAVSQNKLAQMRRDNLEILETVEFRSFLEQQSLGDAQISGMAVTRDRVYLTLEGEPYVLSIRKTDKTQA